MTAYGFWCYVFGGAMSVGTDYITYATPGVILLCAGYGASTLQMEIQELAVEVESVAVTGESA